MFEVWRVEKIMAEDDYRTYTLVAGGLDEPNAHLIILDQSKTVWEVLDDDKVYKFHYRSAHYNNYYEAVRHIFIVSTKGPRNDR